MTTQEESAETKITPSSGNIFADLGVPNPEEYQLKSRLASRIQTSIEDSGWTQVHAAGVLGIKQADVSNITRGRLDGFSVERLLKLLSRLEFDVHISLSKSGQTIEDIAFGTT